MNVIIRKVKLEDKQDVLDMFDEYEKSELIPGLDRYEGIRNFEHLKEKSFEEWLEELTNDEDETKLPEHFSPQSVYLVINDNEEIVGMVNIRWKEVPVLLKYGGFIGYSIRPTQRGKGYAYDMLKETLTEIWKKDKRKVLITCKDFNIPSLKTIERNGGVYLKFGGEKSIIDLVHEVVKKVI